MEGWVGGTGDEDGCGGFGEAGRKKRIVKEDDLDDLLACLRSKVIKFAIV